MSSDVVAAPVPAEPARRFHASTPCFAGSTSVLYEGRDPDSDAKVLVKVVRDGVIGTAAERQRTLRELNKLLAIKHPALPRVIAVGEDEGHIWLARELVEGESLSERVARTGPLPAAQAARVAAQVAAALGELHRQGVLHRDVRPGHVLITPTGAVKLLDAAIGRSYKTPDGRAMTGTPGYVAPESIAGKLVSFRSDLYSLGATLFEALTGAPPYGPSAAPNVLTLQSEHDAPALRVPAPPALAKLVASLLAREPRERPFSAQQLERQLEPLAAFAEPDEGADDPSSVTAIGVTGMDGEADDPPTLAERPSRERSAALAAAARRLAEDEARNEFEDDPTQVGEVEVPSAPLHRAAPAPAPVVTAAPAPRPHTAPHRLPAAPTMPGASPVTNSVVKPAPLGGPLAGMGKPHAPPVGELARKQTLMGISAQALGANAVVAAASTAIKGGAAAAAARAPAPAPVIPPLPTSEGSGRMLVPPPDDPSEFDDVVDTVVQEDSRIFGMPEVGTASPHGSAVPPLPEKLAAQVLTGSNAPAYTPNPTAPHPTTERDAQPWGSQIATDPDQAGLEGGGAPAPVAMPPQPIAAAQPPGVMHGVGGYPGVPGVYPAPGYDAANATASAFNAPQMAYGPSTSGGYPAVVTGGYPQMGGPSGPYPQAGYPPPGYAPGQYPPGYGPPPGYHPGYPQPGYGPPMGAYPGAAPHGYPPPRRSYWPWILAGIGIAGLAGAGGYYFATRDRAPTHEVPVSGAAPATTVGAPPSATPPAVTPQPQGAPALAPPHGGQAGGAPGASAGNGGASAPARADSNGSSGSGGHAGRERHGGHGASASNETPPPPPVESGAHAASAARPVAAAGNDLASARAAISRRDYAAARAILVQVEHAQPNSPEVHALRADIALRGHDMPTAIGELRTAARLAPRNTEYLHRLADAQLAWNDRTAAMATLRQILQINPRDSQAQQQLDQLASRGGGSSSAGRGTSGGGSSGASSGASGRTGGAASGSSASATSSGARPATTAGGGTTSGARAGTTTTTSSGTRQGTSSTQSSGGVPMFGPAPTATRPGGGGGSAVPMSTRWR